MQMGQEITSTPNNDGDHGGPAKHSEPLSPPRPRIGGLRQEYDGRLPRIRLMEGAREWRGFPGLPGRRRGGARIAPGYPDRRHVQLTHQPVRFGQELLHLLKARTTGHTGAEVALDLADLGQIQLSIEQSVQRAFIKMRHSSLVRRRDRLQPVSGAPEPVWFR